MSVLIQYYNGSGRMVNEEEQKHCSLCGLALEPDMDSCPRCGNVIRKKCGDS